MKDRFKRALDGYVNDLANHERVYREVYKFEFSHYVAYHVNWDNHNDEQVLEILRDSQKLHYTGTDGNRGINFMITPLRFNSNLITLKDVKQYRLFKTLRFEQEDWSSKPVTYPIKSAWLAALYPGEIYPTGKTGFDITTNFLFGNQFLVSRQSISYLKSIQTSFKQTEKLLRTSDVGSLWLQGLALYFGNTPELGLKAPTSLSKMDWAWITQDFHFYVLEKMMGEKELALARKAEVQSDLDPFAIEGESRLATHLKRERSSMLVKKAKKDAFKKDPLLHCAVCDFTFAGTYGEIGLGYIEAHHLEPLGDRVNGTNTTIKDFAMVCSNCHRMLHRGERTLSIEELRELVKK